MSGSSRELLACVADIARQAGREILEVYGAGEVGALMKADRSPLTAADLRAHRSICEALHSLTPGVPVLSEEAAETGFATRAGWQRYWLVDAPVLGVVHVPVTDVSYRGLPGAGAWRVAAGEPARAIRVSAASAKPRRVVGSRSHRGDSLDAFLARLGPHELVPMGSSLKFCLVAEGAADVYPRLGPTSEWDTAAAHAVLAGAGGTVVDLGGAPLRYNTRAQLLNPFFVAYGPSDHDWLQLLAA